MQLFVLFLAGNLATPRAVVDKIEGDVPAGRMPTLAAANPLQEAADSMGIVSTSVLRKR